MKRACIAAGLLVLALLISGCTTTPPNTPPPTPEAPDLVGNWTGPMVGYEEGTGYTHYSNETVTMSVTEQHDRVFSGVFAFSNRVYDWEPQPFGGVVDRDGMNLVITEGDGQLCTGVIVDADRIELTYVDVGKPFSVAINYLEKES